MSAEHEFVPLSIEAMILSMWKLGRDTKVIADALWMPEAEVYSVLARVRG